MVNIVKCAYGVPRHSEYEDTLRERSKLARSMQPFDWKQWDNGTYSGSEAWRWFDSHGAMVMRVYYRCIRELDGTYTAGEYDEKTYDFVTTPFGPQYRTGIPTLAEAEAYCESLEANRDEDFYSNYDDVPTPQYWREASRRTFKSAKRKFTMQERMALVDELPEDDDELL